MLWVLIGFIFHKTNLINFVYSQKHCKYEKAKLWLHYKPSLFQHIGMTSSLKGKVQKLKDKNFGKIPQFYAHKSNPVATVKTQIVAYKTHTLARAYTGETFFWGLLPQPGDFLEFIFEEPTVIKKWVKRIFQAICKLKRLFSQFQIFVQKWQSRASFWSFLQHNDWSAARTVERGFSCLDAVQYNARWIPNSGRFQPIWNCWRLHRQSNRETQGIESACTQWQWKLGDIERGE